MKNRISTWVAVGIFLWGFPTGITLALCTTFLDFNEGGLRRPFDYDIFSHGLMIFLPICVFVGIVIGLVIYQSGERSK